MASLDQTPSANRVHIAFFGLRNAGKSTLVNEFTGQPLAIVSDTPGTTTDPVSKAMEILPLGPCLVTDTAGLDDEGELGAKRVDKTLAVLATTDIAVWVGDGFDKWRGRFTVPVLEFRRGDSVERLKEQIASMKLADATPGLLDGLVESGGRVVCVCPIDESAPKGRLILPQVQLIRDCLDRHATANVCQPGELASALGREGPGALVVTDSQAFGAVREVVRRFEGVRLTSFSILFARQKGDLAEFLKGVEAVKNLKDGDSVLIAEGCTHHRQCNDIGTVKIPKAIAKLTNGKKLNFVFSSGTGYPLDSRPSAGAERPAPGANLVVHCGGCMLTRREVLRRVAVAKEAGVPIVNYGILLAAACGMTDVSPEGIVRT
ncbi:MAG: 50S ribosome-binding GTPase [Kiritimatiellae bacterium]|nr:50S ribosome-binding GTPase [Kiritimatiellia bacterium]